MINREEVLKNEIMKLQGPIVIFGASGFIGANLIRTILRFRDDCFGITHQKYIPWRLVDLPVKNIIYADITIPGSIAKVFEAFEFKTIFNFAAYGGYSRQKDTDQIYKTNVLGTSNLLEVAEKTGFSAYVHAGSSSEYGLNALRPKENAELLPNSNYAVSKIANSYLMYYHGLVKKQPVINLRLYSVYGPFEEPDRLIPKLIEHGMQGKFPPLVDPDISRDFVYVDDAVEAAILSATRGVKEAPGKSINIASGKKTTIKEIASIIKDIFKIKNKPTFSTMSNRSWDLDDWEGDPSYAKKVLGWEAKTELGEGLQKTAGWMKELSQIHEERLSPKTGLPIRISAVIACYSDAQAIPIMYDRLTKVFSQLKVEYEIIFVNDASPDNSDEALKRLTESDNHVIAIEHSRNFGSQSAFLSGMQIATGDAVALLDGDLQDPPELIAEFFKKWTEGHEVVYGKRTRRESSWLLNFSYKAFYRVFRGVSYIPIPLDAGDFSLIDRKVVNELLALPETDQYLRGLRAWVGFKQTGVEYIRPRRMFGRSTNSWRKNLWWAKKAIFSFSFIPLEILSYLGWILTGISIIALIGQIIARIFLPNIPQGITTIIVLILFFGAVQILAISLIGEYLSKVFEETKKRPKFIRKAIRYGGKHYSTADEMG
ncbi:MAG: NAD-dependent epimerase/dehydratase family protein, partial [Candidatus Saganbacteria bacterium]|nr:NAD-dependent epimerase/dehydratase family protein [Candidatus Saganbacteria bacterium]